MRLNVCYAALVATLASASPAFAQAVTDQANAEAHGRVLSTHSLINSGALDFGTVTSSAATGTVTVDAAAVATRGFTGGVTLVPSTFSAARFDGLAAPSETVLLTLSPAGSGALTLLDANNDQITGTLAIDANGLTRVTDSNGDFTVYVGGTFNIGATQPNGYYVGTFSLTADYQ